MIYYLYQVDYSLSSLLELFPVLLSCCKSVASLCGEAKAAEEILKSDIPEMLITLLKVCLHLRDYVVRLSATCTSAESDDTCSYPTEERNKLDAYSSECVSAILWCFVVILSSGNDLRAKIGNLVVKNEVSKLYSSIISSDNGNESGSNIKDPGLSLLQVLMDHAEHLSSVMFNIQFSMAEVDESADAAGEDEDDGPAGAHTILKYSSTPSMYKAFGVNAGNGNASSINLKEANGGSHAKTHTLEIDTSANYVSVIFPDLYEELTKNREKTKASSQKKRYVETDREYVVMKRYEIELEHVFWALYSLIVSSGYGMSASSDKLRKPASKRTYDPSLFHNNVRATLLYKSGLALFILRKVLDQLAGLREAMAALNVGLAKQIRQSEYETKVYKKKRTNLKLYKMPSALANMGNIASRLLSELS